MDNNSPTTTLVSFNELKAPFVENDRQPSSYLGWIFDRVRSSVSGPSEGGDIPIIVTHPAEDGGGELPQVDELPDGEASSQVDPDFKALGRRPVNLLALENDQKITSFAELAFATELKSPTLGLPGEFAIPSGGWNIWNQGIPGLSSIKATLAPPPMDHTPGAGSSALSVVEEQMEEEEDDELEDGDGEEEDSKILLNLEVKKNAPPLAAISLNNSNIESPTFNNRGESVSKVLRRLRGEGISKEYWMKDENCRECYECKTPFSTFKRKHHCRICGQIFCASCAHVQISGERFNLPGFLRVCNYCHRIMEENPASESDIDSSEDFGPETVEPSPSSAPSLPITDAAKIGAAASVLPPGSPLPGSLMERASTRSGTPVPVIVAHSLRAPFRSDINLDDRHSSDPKMPAFARIAEMMENDTAPLMESSSDEDDEVSLGILRKSRRGLHSSSTIGGIKKPPVSGNRGIQPLVSAATSSSVLLKVQPVVEESNMKQSLSDGGEMYQSLRRRSLGIDDSTGNNPNNHEVATSSSSSGILFSSEMVISKRGKHRRTISLLPAAQMGAAMMDHLRDLLRQMLQDQDVCQQYEWETMLLSLLQKASTFLCPDVRAGDEIDIRSYVKIKRIPGGKPSQSQYIRGVVCTKNLAHKQMLREMVKPRILVLKFALEYERVEGQFLSLEPLIAQEKEYLKNLVARIVALRPSLVLVEKSVARIALDFLLKANVAVAANVKPSVIAAIARCTRADIITSVDKLALEPRAGTCGAFHVKSFVDQRLINGHKTLLFFDECPPELGCTIVLRGLDDDLRKVKKVVDFMVFAAYHLRLETMLIKDQFFDVYRNKPSSNPNIADLEGCEDEEQGFKEFFGVQTIYENTILSLSPGVRLPAPFVLQCISTLCINLKILRQEHPYLYFPKLGEAPIGSPCSLERDNGGKALFSEPTSEQELNLINVYSNYLNDYYYKAKAAKRFLIERGGSVSPLDYQRLFVVYEVRCIVNGSACNPMEIIGLEYYRESDMTLGQYLEDVMLRASHRCEVKNCDRPMAMHYRSYIHGHQQMRVYIDQVATPVPGLEHVLLGWSSCKECGRISPVVPVSEETWKYSVAKFFELSFYGERVRSRPDVCAHVDPRQKIRYFGLHNLAVRIEQHDIKLWEVMPPLATMRYDTNVMISWRKNDADEIRLAAAKFYDSIVERINSFNYDVVVPGKADQAELDLMKLLRKCQNEKAQLLFNLQQLLDRTSDVDVLVLTAIRFQLHKRSSQWDSAFEMFASLYVPQPERDLKRLTTTQLRKLFHERDDFIKSSDLGDSTDNNKSPPDSHQYSSHLAMARTTEKLSNSSSLFDDSTSNDLLEHKPGGGGGSGSLGDTPTAMLKSILKESDLESTAASPPKTKASSRNNSVGVAPLEVPTKPRQSRRTQKIATSRPRRVSLSTIQVYASTQDATKGDSDEEDVDVSTFSKAAYTETNSSSLATPDVNDQDQPYLLDSMMKSFQILDLPSLTESNKVGGELSVDLLNSHKSVLLPDNALDMLGENPYNFVKTIASFWFSSSAYFQPLDYPIPPTEHFYPDSLISIREDEPTSIIAFTLSTEYYRKKLAQMQESQTLIVDTNNKPEYSKSPFAPDIEETMLSSAESHFKYLQFDALRRNCGCQHTFIDSLSRCMTWNARGGKSGSVFMKSKDDRFVIKQMSRSEMEAFLKTAPAYFEYMSQAFFHDLPTALTKIFGFYRIGYKNSVTGKQQRLDVFVMENLFYGRKISRIYDLKGSTRNRHAPSTGKQMEVLMDENLMQIIYDSPIFIREQCKVLLRNTVHNDTLFLAKSNVMDYSLLVGIDQDRKQLVIGIVDYIRTYTWDKKLESWVKESGLLGGGGKEPTIVTPGQYKKRFRDAMERYFTMVPDAHCRAKSLRKSKTTAYTKTE